MAGNGLWYDKPDALVGQCRSASDLEDMGSVWHAGHEDDRLLESIMSREDGPGRCIGDGISKAGRYISIFGELGGCRYDGAIEL